VSGSFRIEMNPAGVRELLRSTEVQRELARRAESIARAAGEGMEVRSTLGRNRARAVVITATKDARIAEAAHRTLSRALDAGRS
jgi:hypothetical protein